MNGILIVNKPAGMTSHDVVNAARRLAKTRRVGHTGTLDPLATGVLVLLIGPATRLAQYIAGHDKAYRATLRLGATTTTYDAEGEIVARYPVTATRADVELALSQFAGTIDQIPPMYSAVKVGGQKLYKLARQGKEIDREPRTVIIHRLSVLDWSPPDVTIEVACSAGTYIRSLAHDLGQVLGCGAHLTALTRTAAGAFDLAQSYTLEALKSLAETGRFEEALLPPQAALAEMPAVQLTPAQMQAVRYGQTLPLDVPDSDLIQALDAGGRLFAILIPVEPGRWRPKLVMQETG